MAQRKAHEVEAWLARPDPATSIVLVYGPDRGLVSERARRFAELTGLPLDDPFAVLKIDGADLAGDNARIIDEVRSIPMFGGKRLVWLRAAPAGKELADTIRLLDAEPPQDAWLLIEAGELRKNAPLRAAAEASDIAMALPCYADDNRAIDRILDTALTEAGITMALDARQAFKAMLGGDRLATRGEIEKLLLYCRDEHEITLADVNASAGDVSALSVDAIVDMMLAGRIADFDRAFSRAIAAGTHPFTILAAATRQLQQLQLMRYRLDTGGGSAQAVVAGSRPPVFFSRRNLMTAALTAWNESSISRALGRLREAVLVTRTHAAPPASACHRTLLSLCLESARLQQDKAG